MKFYYENHCGDIGTFTEKNLVKAIIAAWNIEADLYIIKGKEEKLIFSPNENNEFNSELLEEYGYKVIDGEEEREIVEISTGKIIKYNWKEVIQLI